MQRVLASDQPLQGELPIAFLPSGDFGDGAAMPSPRPTRFRLLADLPLEVAFKGITYRLEIVQVAARPTILPPWDANATSGLIARA
ncbi:MAG TPA: hypothetical protein VLW52_10680 [Opitutaceae bacterium]|nr:hypothetical protein [Opitutaceae bacterium]